MKITHAEYIKKSDVAVLVAEGIFYELKKKYSLKSIEEIAETQSGGTPLRSNSDYYGGNIPWLKSGELNDSFITEAEEYITEKGLLSSSAKLLPKGTLLIAMYGATAGKTGITKIQTATNQAICAVFPKPQVKRDYLFWFFRSHRFQFIEISKGGAQPNISQTVIQKTQLPLPDIKVQNEIIRVLTKIHSSSKLDISVIPKQYRKIVKKLYSAKTISTLIDTELTKQEELLQEFRQSLLLDAVKGKLVEQNTREGNGIDLVKQIQAELDKLYPERKAKKTKEITFAKNKTLPFSIPNNWAWCQLKDICSKIGSGSTPKGSNYSATGIPFIRSQNVYNEGLMYQDVKYISKQVHLEMKGTIFFAKDILLNITGGSLGRCALVPDDFYQGNVSQHVCIIRPTLLLSKFLHKVILSPYFQKLIFSSTTGAGRVGLPKYNLEKFLIPIPPIDEQNRILEKLNQLTKVCDEKEQSIGNSKVYNDKLLRTLFNEISGVSQFAEQEILKKEFDNSYYINDEIHEITDMKIIEILKTSKKPISSAVVWNRSEFSNDIEKFYAELKKLIDIDKTVVEEKKGRDSYLKLAQNEN